MKVRPNIFGQNVPITGVIFTQVGVNSNIATTAHRFQGKTNNKIIVFGW